MFIVKILSEHRNDFTADLKCEHCGHEQHLSSGYHDGHYHQNVLPAIKCKACGKDRRESVPVSELEAVPTRDNPLAPLFQQI